MGQNASQRLETVAIRGALFHENSVIAFGFTNLAGELFWAYKVPAKACLGCSSPSSRRASSSCSMKLGNVRLFSSIKKLE